MINRDIRTVPTDEIKSYLDGGPVDIIIGGPPCQGFSTIGKRASSDPEKRAKYDPRNELVLTYARIIRKLRPKFIVMENVKGILTLYVYLFICKMYLISSMKLDMLQNIN